MSLVTRAALAAALVLAASPTAPAADPLSVEASDNATVQPAGPRSGGSGKAFFNIEGSANGTFASYGVADFNFGALPDAVIGINSISLALTQANASFSTAGDVILSLDTRSPLSDIQPGGTSPLAFDGADPGTATDVGQGDLVLLSLGAGPYSYAVVANGHVDNYALTLDAATEAALIARLNAASPIRVVVGTGGPAVAATWAGATNSTATGPVLNLDVKYAATPVEPASWGRIKSAYR